jgi:hypothetical protein
MNRFVERFERDRRLATRHDLKTPLRVRIWKSDLPEERTESVNLSERGVYFATRSPIVPARYRDIRPEMTVCEARVRSENR